MILSKKYDILKTGYVILLITAFSRPILTIIEGKTPLPLHKILPASLLYITLLLMFLSITHIKWDLVSSAILLFCCYAIASLAWGSELNDLLQLILPFIGYFAVKTYAKYVSNVRLIVTALLIGYAIPIAGSSILMFADRSIAITVYGSGVLRQCGLYFGFHPAAHAMVLFSFTYSLFLTYKELKKPFFQYTVHSIFILSIYCLWHTYVRNGYLGLLLFWMIYLFRWKKRYFIVFLIVLMGLGFWKSSTVQSVFWKADTWDREQNLNTASSGRIMLWSHNLNIFLEMPFYRKMIGSGLGSESDRVIGKEDEIWSSHNDYITLLMTLGVIGLLLYISIFILLLLDIIFYSKHNRAQSIYLSAIFVCLCTSMVTNGYVFRFETSQTFWLIIGCAYNLTRETADQTNSGLIHRDNAII